MCEFTYIELINLLEWADCALYFDDLTPEDKELKKKIVALMDGHADAIKCERCNENKPYLLLGKGLFVCENCVWTGEDVIRELERHDFKRMAANDSTTSS